MGVVVVVVGGAGGGVLCVQDANMAGSLSAVEERRSEVCFSEREHVLI